MDDIKKPLNIVRQQFLESLTDQLPMRQFQFASVLLDNFMSTVDNSGLTIISEEEYQKLLSYIHLEDEIPDKIIFPSNKIYDEQSTQRIPDKIPDLELINKENKDVELKKRIAKLEEALLNIKDLNNKSLNLRPTNIFGKSIMDVPVKINSLTPPPFRQDQAMNNVSNNPTPTTPGLDEEEVEEDEDFDDNNLELVDDPEYDEKGINRVPVEKELVEEAPKPKLSLNDRIQAMRNARMNKKKKAPNVYN